MNTTRDTDTVEAILLRVMASENAAYWRACEEHEQKIEAIRERYRRERLADDRERATLLTD